MNLISEKKKEFALKYGNSPKNTGATRVQIAIFSFTINYLTTHLGKNKRDFNTKRSLQKILSKRKKLQNYLKKSTSESEYKTFISELGIRK